MSKTAPCFTPPLKPHFFVFCDMLSERSIRKKIMRYFEFREKRDGSSSFCIEGSRQDFADYLSVDKSALSRELNKMKKDGLIDFNGDNFTILQKL